MTESVFDPVHKMDMRERYDNGLDMFDLGGNIVLNGVAYNI